MFLVFLFIFVPVVQQLWWNWWIGLVFHGLLYCCNCSYFTTFNGYPMVPQHYSISQHPQLLAFFGKSLFPIFSRYLHPVWNWQAKLFDFPIGKKSFKIDETCFQWLRKCHYHSTVKKANPKIEKHRKKTIGCKNNFEQNAKR